MTDWHRCRLANAHRIWATAQRIAALRVPVPDPQIEHAAYKCYVFVRPERLRVGWGRDRIIEAINAAGVPCYTGSCSEIYLEKAFDGTGWRPEERLPVARNLGENSLMFLVHPTLTQEEIMKTCEILESVMAQASA